MTVAYGAHRIRKLCDPHWSLLRTGGTAQKQGQKQGSECTFPPPRSADAGRTDATLQLRFDLRLEAFRTQRVLPLKKASDRLDLIAGEGVVE